VQTSVTAKPLAQAKSVPYSTRRLTQKGNSTVVRILEEAKNIIVEEGFLGLSFRAIAKRTGTTVGNIGYYYGTKDDLMVDLAEYIFDKWEMRLQREMPPAMTDKLEMFRYCVRYMIDQNKQRKTMFLLLEMWAMANRSRAVSKMMDTFYSRLRASIERMIGELNPSLPADTRALRAALITTQIEGLMIVAGPGKPRHRELDGLEDEAMVQIERMALQI
jgi:AcrR family transcriptional regulator